MCAISRVSWADATAWNVTVGSKTTRVPAPLSRHFDHTSAPSTTTSQVELRRTGVAVSGGADGAVDTVGASAGPQEV